MLRRYLPTGLLLLFFTAGASFASYDNLNAVISEARSSSERLGDDFIGAIRLASVSDKEIMNQMTTQLILRTEGAVRRIAVHGVWIEIPD